MPAILQGLVSAQVRHPILSWAIPSNFVLTTRAMIFHRFASTLVSTILIKMPALSRGLVSGQVHHPALSWAIPSNFVLANVAMIFN